MPKYRDSRNNTYLNHTSKYIPWNYHQAGSSRLNLPISSSVSLFKLDVGRGCDIAHRYKLLASK